MMFRHHPHQMEKRLHRRLQVDMNHLPHRQMAALAADTADNDA